MRSCVCVVCVCVHVLCGPCQSRRVLDLRPERCNIQLKVSAYCFCAHRKMALKFSLFFFLCVVAAAVVCTTGIGVWSLRCGCCCCLFVRCIFVIFSLTHLLTRIHFFSDLCLFDHSEMHLFDFRDPF